MGFLPAQKLSRIVSTASKKTNTREWGGGGGLSSFSYRLMGMYRWMGSHFYSLIDYYGVAVSIELLHVEWDRTFSGFGGSENSGR